MDVVEIAYLKGYRMRKDGTVISHRGKELSLFRRGKGRHGTYLAFNFKHEGSKLNCSAHRLQAFHKFGRKLFKDGILTRHLDGNSINNSWVNIAIGTASDNMMDVDPEIRKNRRWGKTSQKLKK